MKQYGVDRFEENVCVLVDGDGVAVSVERALLPDGVQEGDILSFDGSVYYLRADVTSEKRAEAKSLIDELFN